MERKITTIRDAEALIREWTESYDADCNDLSDENITRAARKLVAHIGGYGKCLTSELAKTFSVDAALGILDFRGVSHPLKKSENELVTLINDAIAEGCYMIGDLTENDAYFVAAQLESMGYKTEIETDDVKGKTVDSDDWKKVLFERRDEA